MEHRTKVLLLVGLGLSGIVGVMMLTKFSLYTNRYGKKLILLRSLLAQFLTLQGLCAAQGIDIDMTDGWRGESDQDADQAAGTSNATFGQSAHNYGAAFDVAPVVNGTFNWNVDPSIWSAIGDAGKSLGLTWGGDFTTITDKPHFELTGWADDNLKLYAAAPITLGGIFNA